MKRYYELVEYKESGAKILYEGNKLIAFNKMKALSKKYPNKALAVHLWEVVQSHWRNYGMFSLGSDALDIVKTWDNKEI